MPVYEYTCSGCGTPFELLFRSRAEEAGVRCPSCGAVQVERRLSVIATPRAGTRPAALPGPCRECGDLESGCPYR